MFTRTHRAILRKFEEAYESRITVLLAENNRLAAANARLHRALDRPPDPPLTIRGLSLSSPPPRRTTTPVPPPARAQPKREVRDDPAPARSSFDPFILVMGAGDSAPGAGGRDKPDDPPPAPDAPAEKASEKSSGGSAEFETGGGFGGESFSSDAGGSDGGGGSE